MIDTKEILRDTYVKVDLGRIAKNMTLIREMAGPDVAVMPVIKANGYGHGAVNIAPVLVESGASYLAVATLTEAMELREAYPDYPLFILGHTPDRLLHYAAEQNITQTVFSLRQARILANAARKAGRKAKVHIKVDTGMGRIGITSVSFRPKILPMRSPLCFSWKGWKWKGFSAILLWPVRRKTRSNSAVLWSLSKRSKTGAFPFALSIWQTASPVWTHRSTGSI